MPPYYADDLSFSIKSGRSALLQSGTALMVLPQPLGPTVQRNSDACMQNLTPLALGTVPPGCRKSARCRALRREASPSEFISQSFLSEHDQTENR
jgi:hypothetical protein